MIVRVWSGRASLASSQAYVQHFRQNVLPELRGISGFLGATLLREDRPGQIEFLVLTRWKSIDDIRNFAGTDVTKAVVEPQAVAILTDFDPTVRHFTVVEDTTD